MVRGQEDEEDEGVVASGYELSGSSRYSGSGNVDVMKVPDYRFKIG